jgi:hypothetical protein
VTDRLEAKGKNGDRPAKNGASKWDFLKPPSKDSSPSWAWAGPEDLQAALVAATEDGVALLFSKTSDGGALALHVLTGGPAIKMYPSSAEEITETLTRVQHIAKQAK